MIYLIDDKIARQISYGWNTERFEQFGNITVIKTISSLIEKKNDIFASADNIILFHESFSSNAYDSNIQIFLCDFCKELKEKETKYPIAYFSGSKSSRSIDPNSNGMICFLPPDVLYANLDTFANRCNNNDFNFKYLLFGENQEVEEELRNQLETINNNNWIRCKDGVSVTENIFYAYTDNYACDCIFNNAVVDRDWDFFNQDIPDIELEAFVKKWFCNNEYDAIFLPLCFAQTLSDFLGLRLAMHIRLTASCCQFKPIFIYGETPSYYIANNDCFDVLKFTDVSLIRCDYDSMLFALKQKKHNNANEQFEQDIKKIHIEIPDNIGDNHSVSNQWARFRWKDMLNWNGEEPELADSDFQTSIYFKYLIARFGTHDRFNKKEKKYPCKIDDISGKTIIYIDDEFDKGWANIFDKIFISSGANFVPFKDFNKKYSRKELVDRIELFLDENEADCYLLDLRLHESDFAEDSKITGHEIAEYIKQKNKGNQIVVFTASNKIWNLKKEVYSIGAIGYTMKESPELNNNRTESINIFIEFSKAIKKACNLSYLKDLYDTQNHLKKICPEVAELDNVIELLSLDAGNNKPIILKTVLLTEIVFLENYIRNIDQLSLYKTGKETAECIELCNNEKNIFKLTDHLFVKREEIVKGRKNIVDYMYSDTPIEVPSLWSNISDTDATLAIASLLLFYKLEPKFIKEYINLKLIRNTQVAHSEGDINDRVKQQFDLNINVEKLIQFYYDVIAKVISKKST